MLRLTCLCFWMLLLAPRAFSIDACTKDSRADEVCVIELQHLHPTQLSYGKEEVRQRAAEITAMSASKRKDYIKSHPVLVVIGPHGNKYITDHHHFALAVAMVLGETAEVRALVLKNWSDMPLSDFWEKMVAAEYAYTFDEDGFGPWPTSALPDEIFDLKDDPYRSLAWAVRKKGGYAESDTSHADFLWANFFRRYIAKSQVQNDFARATDFGVDLAKTEDAQDLPGSYAR